MNTWDITALLAFHRSVFGQARMEDPPADAPADPPADPSKDEPKFTQADVDRIMGETRRKAKPADYDDVKAKAKQFDDLQAANASEMEKAVKAARAEGAAEVAARANERLVGAEARALAAEMKFRNPATAVRLLDLSGVKVGEDGDVDSARVRSLLDTLGKTEPYLIGDGRPKGDVDQGARDNPPKDVGTGRSRLAAAYARKT